MRRNNPRSRGYITPPDLVSTTLIYPVTLTTDDHSSGGITISVNASASLAQQPFQIQNSSGSIKFSTPPDGYSKISGDIRAYNASGNAYVAAVGTSPACLQLADGSSAQGSKLWSGTGAPTSSTVGTSSTGDYYLRRYNASPAATIVAASRSTSGTTASACSVGTGTLGNSATKILDGTPAAGDLLLIAVSNTVATETCTIGADTGITDGSADGGVLEDNGTRRIHFFSHVIQAGDISASQVAVTALTNNAGTGRRIDMAVFRHDWGFSTTGSKHGCPIFVSDANSTTGTPQTRSATGPTAPSVSMVTAFNSSNPTAPGDTFVWDGGSNSNTNSDSPGGSNTAQVATSWRPGVGTNTSGAAGLTTGGSSVVMDGLSGTTASLLGVWQPKTTPPSTNILYFCTSGGTPGTWTAVW